MLRCEQGSWDIHLWWTTHTHSISIIHLCQVFCAEFNLFHLFQQVSLLQEKIQNTKARDLKCFPYFIIRNFWWYNMQWYLLHSAVQLGCKLSQVTYKPDLFDTKFKLKTTFQNLRKSSETLYTHSKEACTCFQICILLCIDIIMYHILADHLFASCELWNDWVSVPLGKALGKTCM